MSLMDDLDKAIKDVIKSESERVKAQFQIEIERSKEEEAAELKEVIESSVNALFYMTENAEPFNIDKAKQYYDALMQIASEKKYSGYYGESDNWFEVSKAREALGLPEDIPEIDDADF